MGAEILLTLGVSFILFHGGLQLSTRILSRVAVGLGLLAVPGVVITALVAGLGCGSRVRRAVLDRAPDRRGVGADRSRRFSSRSSTASASGQKIEQTAIAESALNDATGAVLALVFAGVVLSGEASVTEPAVDFVAGPRDLDRARDRRSESSSRSWSRPPGGRLA